MGPKKKAAKGDKKKDPSDEEEDKGPSIFSELLTKQVQDIEARLEQPVTKINIENIEFESLVQKLSDDIVRFKTDNERLEKKSKLTAKEIERDADQREISIKTHVQERAKQIVSKAEQLDVYTNADVTLTQQRLKHQDLTLIEEEKHMEKLANMDDQLIESQYQFDQLKIFQEKQEQFIAERDSWQEKLDQQRKKHANQIETIENEKVQEIEKLRKEMLLQIRAVKVNMLNLNEDQLQGTTKLTVIQNAQLTGELEYQSKQTEHLMFKNHQMQSMIRNLKRDLSDHQEVERELAKRSHFCQKVINKYKTQSKDLKSEIDILIIKRKKLLSGEEPQRQRDESDLLDYLNERIASYEIRLKQTHKHLCSQEQEYVYLIDKVLAIKAKYTRCDLLLAEFIEFFVEQEPDLLNRESDIFLDIDQIKEADNFETLPPQCLVALCLVLRKQLQPYITELSKTQYQHSYQRHVSQIQQNSNLPTRVNTAPENSSAYKQQQVNWPDMRQQNHGMMSSEGYATNEQEMMIRKANVTMSTRDDDNALAFNKMHNNKNDASRSSQVPTTGYRHDGHSTQISQVMGSRGTNRIATAGDSFIGGGQRIGQQTGTGHHQHPGNMGVLSLQDYKISPHLAQNYMPQSVGSTATPLQENFGMIPGGHLGQTAMYNTQYNQIQSPGNAHQQLNYLNPIQQQQQLYSRKPNTTERMPYYMNLRKRQNNQIGNSMDRAAGGIGRTGRFVGVGGGVINDNNNNMPVQNQQEQDGPQRYRYNSSSIPYVQRNGGSVGFKRRQNNINYMNQEQIQDQNFVQHQQFEMPQQQQMHTTTGVAPYLMQQKDQRHMDSPRHVGVKDQLASGTIAQATKDSQPSNTLPHI